MWSTIRNELKSLPLSLPGWYLDIIIKIGLDPSRPVVTLSTYYDTACPTLLLALPNRATAGGGSLYPKLEQDKTPSLSDTPLLVTHPATDPPSHPPTDPPINCLHFITRFYDIGNFLRDSNFFFFLLEEVKPPLLALIIDTLIKICLSNKLLVDYVWEVTRRRSEYII